MIELDLQKHRSLFHTPKMAVVVGRFQPLTLLQEELIEGAKAAADKVLVVVGSSFEARSLKNPFPYEFRKEMIEARFGTDDIIVVPIEDYIYRDQLWYSQFNKIIGEYQQQYDVFLYTCAKDAPTAKYIDGFDKSLKRVFHTSSNLEVHATKVRDDFFSHVPALNIPNISENVAYKIHYFKASKDYEELCKELEAVKAYKKTWACAPFPPHFIAVDALVTWEDYWNKPHILVIKRKSEFGNGKLAIPGGYLDVNETVYESAVRELREETTLAVDSRFLLDKVTVFDAPNRSMRGRMVTHLHQWTIHQNQAPVVEGQDDAAEAFWMPLDEVRKNKQNFFSDHYHIIAKVKPVVEAF